MSIVKPKHSELMHAFADGAYIQQRYQLGVWKSTLKPDWFTDAYYRIDPKCNYALSKIAELNNGATVELYLQWLEGVKLEYLNKDNWYTLTAIDIPSANNSPLDFFLTHKLNKIRKKKRTVTMVTWVCGKFYWDRDSSFLPYVEIPVDQEKPTFEDMKDYRECNSMANQIWHKVPTMTKEVEVDD